MYRPVWWPLGIWTFESAAVRRYFSTSGGLMEPALSKINYAATLALDHGNSEPVTSAARSPAASVAISVPANKTRLLEQKTSFELIPTRISRIFRQKLPV